MALHFGLGATPATPDDPDEKRAALLEAVESIRPTLEACAAENEVGGTLAAPAVEALRDTGLLALKLPRELGGAEADPIVQMDVIEAVTLIDPAAAWSMFISSAVVGGTAANASEEVLELLFRDGRHPSMAGTLKPDGQARRVDGGFRISGRWSWGSGIRHADFVRVMSFADEPKTVIGAVIPLSDVEVVDNWHVLGMKGTGSCDYVLDDVFVADVMVNDMATVTQQRGGALYRMGMPGYVVNEHMIFAMALAKRSLHAFIDFTVQKRRGYMGATTIADRATVQRFVSEASLQLHAGRLLCDEVLTRLFTAAELGPPAADVSAEARAAATYVTDLAIDIVSAAFRHAGGQAVYLDSEFERCLRDLYTIQSHFVVHDSSFEQHGQLLLGVEGGVSMA